MRLARRLSRRRSRRYRPVQSIRIPGRGSERRTVERHLVAVGGAGNERRMAEHVEARDDRPMIIMQNGFGLRRRPRRKQLGGSGHELAGQISEQQCALAIPILPRRTCPGTPGVGCASAEQIMLQSRPTRHPLVPVDEVEFAAFSDTSRRTSDDGCGRSDVNSRECFQPRSPSPFSWRCATEVLCPVGITRALVPRIARICAERSCQ